MTRESWLFFFFILHRNYAIPVQTKGGISRPIVYCLSYFITRTQMRALWKK